MKMLVDTVFLILLSIHLSLSQQEIHRRRDGDQVTGLTPCDHASSFFITGTKCQCNHNLVFYMDSNHTTRSCYDESTIKKITGCSKYYLHNPSKTFNKVVNGTCKEDITIKDIETLDFNTWKKTWSDELKNDVLYTNQRLQVLTNQERFGGLFLRINLQCQQCVVISFEGSRTYPLPNLKAKNTPTTITTKLQKNNSGNNDSMIIIGAAAGSGAFLLLIIILVSVCICRSSESVCCRKEKDGEPDYMEYDGGETNPVTLEKGRSATYMNNKHGDEIIYANTFAQGSETSKQRQEEDYNYIYNDNITQIEFAQQNRQRPAEFLGQVYDALNTVISTNDDALNTIVSAEDETSNKSITNEQENNYYSSTVEKESEKKDVPVYATVNKTKT